MLFYILIIHFHTFILLNLWQYNIVHPKEQKGPITLWHSYKVRKTYCTNVVVTRKWLILLDWCITMSNWWMTNWLAPKWCLSKVQKQRVTYVWIWQNSYNAPARQQIFLLPMFVTNTMYSSGFLFACLNRDRNRILEFGSGYSMSNVIHILNPRDDS